MPQKKGKKSVPKKDLFSFLGDSEEKSSSLSSTETERSPAPDVKAQSHLPEESSHQKEEIDSSQPFHEPPSAAKVVEEIIPVQSEPQSSPPASALTQDKTGSGDVGSGAAGTVDDFSEEEVDEEEGGDEGGFEEAEDEVGDEVDDLGDEQPSKGEQPSGDVQTDVLALLRERPLLLLNCYYNRGTNRATLQFYDKNNNRLVEVDDPSGHEPYLIVKLLPEDAQRYLELSPDYVQEKHRIKRLEVVEVIDRLRFRRITCTKLFTQTPGDVPTIRGLFHEQDIPTFESDIRYHINYLYDRELITGMHYQLEGTTFRRVLQNELGSKVPANAEEEQILSDFKGVERYASLVDDFLPLFTEDIPEILYYTLDIEVNAPAGVFPTVSAANYEVSCVSVVSNAGDGVVFYLNPTGQPVEDLRHTDLPPEVVVRSYTDEKSLLLGLYEMIATLPVVVTFNGNAFDIPYLVNRNRKLRVTTSAVRYNGRTKMGSFGGAIHIDLYNWFSNPAIRLYAYSGVYKDNKLGTIANALLGEEKYQYEGEIWDLEGAELVYYCWRDTQITSQLLSHDDYTTYKIMLLLARITHVPLSELVSRRVSSWLQYFFQFEHRRRNYLIPTSREIRDIKGSEASSQAISKDKKFQGATVISPKKGVHFDVTVLDFASLYPSIISSRNLSYETILCGHPECVDNKVPLTNYYVCKQEVGLISKLIGFLKDVRVSWFKKLAKSPTHPDASYYKIVEKSLKVLINAAYGVLGAEFFAFYCLPVAEATTAVGRHAIERTVEKCQSLSVDVLYGDTDSVFIATPEPKVIDQIMSWSSDELGIALEVDKEYRFIALSDRKKNYVGVLKNGGLDIKGLLGKKSNTPPFIQEAFSRTLEILQGIQSPDDFTSSKEKIKVIISELYDRVEKSKRVGKHKKSFGKEDLAITMQLTKFTHQYEGNVQHVKAARTYEESVRSQGNTDFRLEPGQFVSFVKGKQDPVPLELVEEGLAIDVEAYRGQVDSTFTQVLEALGINIATLQKSVNLFDFI